MDTSVNIPLNISIEYVIYFDDLNLKLQTFSF